eukprot:TRINITY_DN18537_c0_g2_i1.p1 TRINITY_DN18537_c0_g2~~TRINITY_DN18537_c0_g2_i1.p1  ORF type:complete len:465 (+),score=81.01 TRINITY_DN18537_c0_g2_i1:104-1498(+)
MPFTDPEKRESALVLELQINTTVDLDDQQWAAVHSSMRFNVAYAVALWLMMIFAWKTVQKHYSWAQRWTHNLKGPLPWLLQWYSLLYVGLTVFMTITVVRMLAQLWHYIAPGDYVGNEDTTYTYGMPEWLLMLSVVGACCAVASFLVIPYHVLRITRRVHRRRVSRQADFVWMVNDRDEMVLVLIMLPSVYSILSARSVSRMWQALTARDTGAAALLDVYILDMNFALGNLVQFACLLEFARLCHTYISHGPDELKWAMKWAGLQGVFSYVLVGGLSTAGKGLVALMKVNGMDASFVEDVSHSMEPIVSAAMLQCIYNMAIVSLMPRIQNALGNAFAKFNGTRIILLCSQLQVQVLVLIHEWQGKSQILQSLRMNVMRSHLIHASLLGVECLVSVMFSFYAWEIGSDGKRWGGKAPKALSCVKFESDSESSSSSSTGSNGSYEDMQIVDSEADKVQMAMGLRAC